MQQYGQYGCMSNIPFHIASAVQGFVAKTITRITITIKTISILGNLVPSWNCLFPESALRNGANSLINSLMSSVFCANTWRATFFQDLRMKNFLPFLKMKYLLNAS